uniref:Uncharacterized protein n=1 Tax=Desertifilum tharense IPPAS B-1220 TaxID=1781255 RepID=A0ACD5GR11_9CYAN
MGGRRELGVGSWGLGKKKGIGSWELGVGEEEGSWELGVRIWGEEKIGRLDNCQLSTLFPSPLSTPFSPTSPPPHPPILFPTQHSALSTQHYFPLRRGSISANNFSNAVDGAVLRFVVGSHQEFCE